jgi:hypothetical protein
MVGRYVGASRVSHGVWLGEEYVPKHTYFSYIRKYAHCPNIIEMNQLC